jgi:hypothetical protein
MRRDYLVPFCILTLLLMLILLFGPRYPDQIFRPISYRNVDLPGPFALSLSVDSPAFMKLALEPSGLLAPKQLRQSRPGMVLAATPLALALATVVHPSVVASFLAYMMLHVATIVASFGMYLAIVRPPRGAVSVPVFLTGLLLLFNDVTTYFVLSPHTALFNLLAPLFCLWIADRAWRDGLFHERRVFLVAMLAGLGFTCYGSFLLAIPALLLPAAFRDKAAGRAVGAAFLGRSAAITAALLAPIAAWYAVVIAVNGTFYSAEVTVFRSFVWMADDLRSHGPGWVISKLFALAWLGIRHGLPMALPALAIVAATLLVLPEPRALLWQHIRADAVLALFVSLLFGAFFLLSGFVWDRNVYSATIPFIAVAGASVAYAERRLPERRRRLCGRGFLLATVAFAAYMLVKDVTW